MAQEQQDINAEDLKDLDRYAQKLSQESSFDQLLKLPVPNVSRVGSYFMALVMVAALLALYYGKVNVVVQARGLIQTVEDTFRIESRSGGIITRILAKPGDQLAAGAPILHLDSSEKSLDRDQLQNELAILDARHQKESTALAVAERILAAPQRYLQEPAQPDLTGQLLSGYLRLRSLWVTLTNERDVHQKAAKEREHQLAKEIDLADEKIKTLQQHRLISTEELKRDLADLEKKEQMLADFRKLTEEGYYAEIELNREEEQFKAARRAADENKKALAQADLVISNERIRQNELRIKRHEIKRDAAQRVEAAELAFKQTLTEFKEAHANLKEDVQKLNSQIAVNQGRLRINQEHINKNVIRMPFDGYIGAMRVSNIGQVVMAGSVLTMAYPAGSPLEVLVEIPNKDIGQISTDTTANVKVDAFAFKEFGTISGRVERIIPNLSGRPGFAVVVELDQQALVKDGKRYQIFPGLTVQVDFVTRRIRLYQLIIKQLHDLYAGSTPTAPKPVEDGGAG